MSVFMHQLVASFSSHVVPNTFHALGPDPVPPADSATFAVEQCRHLSSRRHRLVVALCGFSPSHLPPPPPPILPLLINDEDVQGIIIEMPATPPIIFLIATASPSALSNG